MSDYLNQFAGRDLTVVREREHGGSHDVYAEPPSPWAAGFGATHTLDCGEGHGRGTRPAILKKTVLYVGVDEKPDGEGIVWERWGIRHLATREADWRHFTPREVGHARAWVRDVGNGEGGVETWEIDEMSAETIFRIVKKNYYGGLSNFKCDILFGNFDNHHNAE
jgi:hypothetical protein